jgi:hypothetical protein
LIATALLSLTSLGETTLLAGVALLALHSIYFLLVHLQKKWRVIPEEARDKLDSALLHVLADVVLLTPLLLIVITY